MSKRTYTFSSDEEMNIPSGYARSDSRLLRRLPKRSKTSIRQTFSKYRSITCTSSSDSITDSEDTDLGTALSDVESHLKHFERESSPSMEGDEVESALGHEMCMSPSPERHFWVDDVKGKTIDPREYGGDSKRRRREQEDSDCEADDELGPVIRKKVRMAPSSPKSKLPSSPANFIRANLGPTKSILDITHGVNKINPSAMDEDTDRGTDTETEDDEDDRMVSASLAAVPDSPTPLPRQPRRPLVLTLKPIRKPLLTSHQVIKVKEKAIRKAQIYRRPASFSDEDMMITSEIEQELTVVNKQVVRRTRLNQFSERLPGQFTSAHLRRTSPSSLLPMREKRQHLRADYAKVTMFCGQVLLAEMKEMREKRQSRYRAMSAFNRKFDLRQSGVQLLNPLKIFKPLDALPVARKSTLNGIWCKRLIRDRKRRMADKAYRMDHAQPCRISPPLLSPSFEPINLLSPETRNMICASTPGEEILEEVEEVEYEAMTEISMDRSSTQSSTRVQEDRPSSPTLSEPPEYEEQPPDLPTRLPIQSRRPLVHRPPVEAPRYVWLNSIAGGEYTRRSPSPPPPFNAQTDREVVVPARFDPNHRRGRSLDRIDSSLWFDPDFVAPPRRRRSPERGMIGAFPSLSGQPQPISVTSSALPVMPTARPVPVPAERIIAPVPVRRIEMRSNWEAALDLEEGEIEDDDVEGALGNEETIESSEEGIEEGGAVLGRLGRLVRSVWRW